MADITAYRKELKDRILLAADEAFKRNGIKAVRMDDIANNLSISKRTLYELFQNKEVLLFETIKKTHADGERNMKQYALQSNNVMDIVLHFLQLRIDEFGTINPLYFEEIHRYPEIVQFLKSNENSQRCHTLNFFERGVDEGFFRSDVNYEIVCQLNKASIDYIMRNQLYKEFPMTEIFRNLVMLNLRGCCTEKGIKALDLFSKNIICKSNLP